MEQQIKVKEELKRVGLLTAIILGVLLLIWLIDLKTDWVLKLGKGLARLTHFE